MLSQRVAGPLMQMAQLINQCDEARAAVEIVGDLRQPAARGRHRRRWRAQAARRAMSNSPRCASPTRARSLRRSTACRSRFRWARRWASSGVRGSGKTTVTRLLQRLHSDYEGLIKIDGVDVREYNIAHLAPQSRRGAAGKLPVQRHDPRKHHRRQARRHIRRSGARRAARRRRGIHRPAAARLRHLYLRRLAQPLGRPEASALPSRAR